MMAGSAPAAQDKTSSSLLTLQGNWRFETDADGIAWLYLDKVGENVNTLSTAVLDELDTCLTQINEKAPRGLVILSAKDNGFILGADINEFTKITDEAQAFERTQAAHALFDRLASLPYPTVAAIDGYCLGGGLELALACRYRVASADNPDTRIGLPEVLLGIHPGFGGTARLTRLIGAPQAMSLMLSGRTLRPQAARKLGVLDYAVPGRHLHTAAQRIINERPKLHKPGLVAWLANLGLVRPTLARLFKRQVAARASPEHYPAPYALIDLWSKHGDAPRRMMQAEARSVAKLIVGPTARNLVRVFLMREKLKAVGKAEAHAPVAEHAHVIGAGVMGGDIAAWCALKGLRVTVQDHQPEALGRVMRRAHDLFQKKLREDRLVTAAMDRLMPDPGGYGIRLADVVIEAIFEDLDAKQSLFKTLEPKLKPGAVLATNTSSIPLDKLSQVLETPSRLVGLHFFNPVPKMLLVEVVSDAKTSQQEATRAAAFTHQIGRLPLPVKSAPGFLVNRVLTPYLMEAVALLNEGVPGAVIDKAAKDFGMPMGPIELADTVGLDICLSVAENLSETLSVSVPKQLRAKVQAGQLGLKSGQGFYAWKGKKARKPKPDKARSVPEDVTDRLILRMLNEAVACLREGIVAESDLLDAGIIFGTGFAPFRGGPLHYIREQGVQKLSTTLSQFADKYGGRYSPDAGWAELDKA